MAVLTEITRGGHYGDLDLRGVGRNSRNKDTALFIRLKAGEVATFWDVKTRDVFNPVIIVGEGRVHIHSIDNQDFGGDGIQARSSHIHIDYTNVEEVTPTRPYKVCERLGSETIEQCLLRNGEVVFDPSILEWERHPNYSGDIIAACHVDALVQLYATQPNGYTLNPAGIITDIRMPHVRARIDDPKVQLVMGSENNDYSDIHIGTETFDIEMPYLMPVVFNTLSNSKIGCEHSNVPDGCCVKIKEVKPRPGAVPSHQKRTFNNEILGFRPECVIERCAAGHDHLSTKVHEADIHEDLFMKMSPEGIEKLIASEGARADAYFCTANCLTIGVGHALTKSEITSGRIHLESGRVLDFRDRGLNKEEVTALLNDDLIRFNLAINEAVTVGLSQHQFDALVHFSFNIGVAAFKRSTLLKKLNQGHYSEVPHQIRRWVKQRELKGRRETEVAMWLGNHPNPINIKQLDHKSKAGLVEKAKKVVGSRTVFGSGTALGGVVAAVSAASELAKQVASDPVTAVSDLADKSKQASEKVGDAVESVSSMAQMLGFTQAGYTNFLFWGLMACLCIIAIGAGLALYARWDDDRTGKNPILIEEH